MSPFAHLKQGDKVNTRGGGTVEFIAYVPAASPAHKIVVLDAPEVLTFWGDGVFSLDREPCGLDLIPPVKDHT